MYQKSVRNFARLTGKTASSREAAILHVLVLGGYAKMLMHTVNISMPLLLMRPSMAKVGMVIDVHSQTVKYKMTYLQGNWTYSHTTRGGKVPRQDPSSGLEAYT